MELEYGSLVICYMYKLYAAKLDIPTRLSCILCQSLGMVLLECRCASC